MTATSAWWRDANWASASALLCAVSATTLNTCGVRPTRSRVLLPTDPVAPSTLIRLGLGREPGRDVAEGKLTTGFARAADTLISQSLRPEQERPRGRMHVDHEACKPQRSGRGHDPVHAIHDAAVAGD